MQRKPWQNVTPILDLKKEKSIIKLGIRGNVFTRSSVRNICQKMQGSLIPNVDMSEDFLLRKLIFNISKQHCNGGSTFLIRKTLKRRKLFSFIKYTIICLNYFLNLIHSYKLKKKKTTQLQSIMLLNSDPYGNVHR